MTAAYGVRLTAIGPNRLAVLSRARPLLQRSPAMVKAEFDTGRAVELATDVSRWTACELAEEFRQLGADVEIYITSACPSACSSHDDH